MKLAYSVQRSFVLKQAPMSLLRTNLRKSPIRAFLRKVLVQGIHSEIKKSISKSSWFPYQMEQSCL